MPGTSCLYRRPSGIYAVRLVVPRRLRDFIGRTEIHTSTGLRDLSTAKAAALRIQLHWRERFLAMDSEKLRHANPLLAGDGRISITEAADATGLSAAALAGELLGAGASAYLYMQARHCWIVPGSADLDLDHDGAFVRGDVESKGDLRVHSGWLRPYDSSATLALCATGAPSCETVFHGDGGSMVFVEPMDDPLRITLDQCFVSKGAVASVRERLAASLPPAPAPAPVAPPAASTPASQSSPVVLDTITAKHGHKPFSHLFDLMRKDKAWTAATAKRMETEAGLFVGLMDDPKLGEIEKATVHEFARLLALLPTDIYQARRKYGKCATLHELIVLAERDGLRRKTEATVKRHVSNLSEILGYGVRAGMVSTNYASDYKRGRTDMRRAQDQRDIFTPDELARIFSQEWFVNGSGKFESSGWTLWRPHYYWLPIMGLLVGERINELSQLYLNDIRQTESGAWVVDFNLNEPDKSDADESDGRDKSLKTVNAIRVVPMHPLLVRLGLPEYVAALRKAGHARLFPELKRDPMKGYGKPVSSWFNGRFLGTQLKIKRDGKKTFHSLRHGFVTALERLDLPERVAAQLVGHERGKTTAMTQYAKDRDAGEVAAHIARLDFPQLAGIAPFKTADALRAIKVAGRLKASAAKRP